MRAAVLAPLYEDASGDLRVVLTVRPDYMTTHAGDVVFPGGVIEPEDDGPIDTALREAHEEVGIEPGEVEVLGGLDPVTTRDVDNLIVPVVGRFERTIDLVPHDFEVAVILEPRIDELLDEERWERRDIHGFPLWYYEFPEATLWGATAFMVRDLLRYLR